jgi:hypothetical protein
VSKKGDVFITGVKKAEVGCKAEDVEVMVGVMTVVELKTAVVAKVVVVSVVEGVEVSVVMAICVVLAVVVVVVVSGVEVKAIVIAVVKVVSVFVSEVVNVVIVVSVVVAIVIEIVVLAEVQNEVVAVVGTVVMANLSVKLIFVDEYHTSDENGDSFKKKIKKLAFDRKQTYINYRKVFLAERKGKVYVLQIVEKGAN